MKRKLGRLLRFKTEEFQTENRKYISKRSSGISSGKNTNQSKQGNGQKQYFINTAIKSTEACKKLVKSTYRNKFLRKMNTQQNFSLNIEELNGNRTLKDLGQKHKYTLQIFKDQIKMIGQQQLKTVVNLERLIRLGQKLVEQVYCYGKVQSFLTNLNFILKQIGSKSLKFKGYCLSGQSFYVYGSYSLSIFYFDKALKILAEKQKILLTERQKQIDVYRTIANIFLIKNQFNTAKQFAYKYLRKAWHLNILQEELNAYDFLGKIYHELEQKDMSSYFHNKMCKGERQTKQIINISNYELEKQERQTREFAVYETVEVFINSNKIFHEMLEDRYRMKNRNFTLEITDGNGQFFFHTHRSPNRNLNTYRILQRKMIVQKQSKQLHFIKPKQTGTLKKLIGTFAKLVTHLRDEYLQGKQNFQEIGEVFSVSKRY